MAPDLVLCYPGRNCPAGCWTNALGYSLVLWSKLKGFSVTKVPKGFRVDQYAVGYKIIPPALLPISQSSIYQELL
jgi:hypothetical protein